MTVIAIDGPSGTGKSTAARQLAEALDYTYFDTGAMYRAVTWLALKRQTDLADLTQVEALLEAFSFHIEQEGLERRYMVGDADVTEAIRSPEVTAHVSAVSALAPVREAMVPIQREAGERNNIVCEGRDMGTVVFPKADVKIFLTARPEVRARRRYQELASKSPSVKLTEKEILADQKRRDTHDSTRKHSPLAQAPDAVEVDTSDLTLDGVVDTLLQIVNDRLS